VPAGFALRLLPGYGRGSRFYTVRRGDTLSSIAARHGMTVTELASLNGLRNTNHITIGQRLRLAR